MFISRHMHAPAAYVLAGPKAGPAPALSTSNHIARQAQVRSEFRSSGTPRPVPAAIVVMVSRQYVYGIGVCNSTVSGFSGRRWRDKI
jgi:hypothetical protein